MKPSDIIREKVKQGRIGREDIEQECALQLVDSLFYITESLKKLELLVESTQLLAKALENSHE